MTLPRVFYGQKTLDIVQDYIKNYEKHDDVMPSIAGLSVVMGNTRKTINEWCRK